MVLAGSDLIIYCDIIIHENVDTPFNITTTWIHNDDIVMTDFRRMSYGPYSTGFNQYQSRIEFSTLSSTVDNGTYTCNVSVTSDPHYSYVSDAEDISIETTFSVFGE